MQNYIGPTLGLLGYAAVDQARRLMFTKEQRTFATILQEDSWNTFSNLLHPYKWYALKKIEKQQGSIGDIQYSIYSSKLSWRIGIAVKGLFSLAANASLMLAGTAFGCYQFQFKRTQCIAALATAMLMNIAVQGTAVRLEIQQRSHDNLLKVSKEHFKLNPEGAVLEKICHASPTVKKLAPIYQAYIATSEGQEWLQLVMKYHDKDENGIFLLLANELLKGTCGGWTLALIKASSLLPYALPSELIEKVNGADIIYYQFQKTLQKECLLANKSSDSYIAYYDKNKEVLERIRSNALKNQGLMTAQLHRLDDKCIFWICADGKDARALGGYAALTEAIDKEVELIEKKGKHACCEIDIIFNNAGHAMCVRYAGPYLYFSCNNKGLYQASNRQELHACISNYLQSMPQAISRVDVIFYEISTHIDEVLIEVD